MFYLGGKLTFKGGGAAAAPRPGEYILLGGFSKLSGRASSWALNSPNILAQQPARTAGFEDCKLSSRAGNWALNSLNILAQQPARTAGFKDRRASS